MRPAGRCSRVSGMLLLTTATVTSACTAGHFAAKLTDEPGSAAGYEDHRYTFTPC
jgi:nicotinamide mononucleotide (NMN) deamidase PncC